MAIPGEESMTTTDLDIAELFLLERVHFFFEHLRAVRGVDGRAVKVRLRLTHRHQHAWSNHF